MWENELCSQVEKYLDIYWKKMDSMVLTKFPDCSHIFPDVFLNPRKIILFYSDEGVVISLWDGMSNIQFGEKEMPIGISSITDTCMGLDETVQFLSHNHAKIGQVDGSLPEDIETSKLGELLPLYTRFVDEKGQPISIPTIVFPPDESGNQGSFWLDPEIGKSGEKGHRIFQWRMLGVFNWSRAKRHFVPSLAQTRANEDLLSFLSAYHLNLPKNALKNEIIAGLEKVISEFEKLLNRDERDEESLKQFIKSNSILLGPEAVNVKSEHRLGSEYKADIVIERKTDSGPEYNLVELEPSNLKWFTGSGDWRKEANHAMRQVEDWQEWIEANISYAEKRLPGIRNPSCMIIIDIIGNKSKMLPKVSGSKGFRHFF